LFSKAAPLPDGSEKSRLGWILAKTQSQAVLDRSQTVPEGSAQEQAAWLTGVLNDAGALNPLKMPAFLLNDADAEALTIALMSQSAERVSLANYEVPRKLKPIFDPKDDFGGLEQRYRCLSCHSIRGSGDPQACDITLEGSKVNREWLYDFLKNPYSMRRTITIAMPLFNFPDDQARFMSEYISAVFVDRQIGAGWNEGQRNADAIRGKALFDAKGCIACHQVHGKGGDVGPSLTTQVPEFPQGTWAGDKLRAPWVYQWLKDPQSLVPDTLEPNLGLSDQEALDLTQYVMSLKNPDFQKKK
jgi:mono/diheme cytochrome c family protein